jgi:hypothetical protein
MNEAKKEPTEVRYGVPGRRWRNADGSLGGWVADRATVAAGVWVGPSATIWGGTIWGGTIEGGTIEGGTIRGGTIEGGTIEGGTIRGGTIEGGTIRGGTIEGGTIWGGTIWGGTIEGGTIRTSRDVLAIGPVGSEDQWVTLVRCDTDTGEGTGHRLTIGCWNGENTVDDLAGEVARRGLSAAHVAEYEAIETLLRIRLAEWGQTNKENR